MTEAACNRGTVVTGESRMLPALVDFLTSSRRIRGDSLIVTELPWHGRRVDLATYTRSGVTSAYELKLGGFGRVLEQAIYNKLSFDRSWLVVPTVPTVENQALARRYGVGVIVAEPFPRVLISAPRARNEPALTRRLRMKMRSVARVRVFDV